MLCQSFRGKRGTQGREMFTSGVKCHFIILHGRRIHVLSLLWIARWYKSGAEALLKVWSKYFSGLGKSKMNES